MKLSEDLNLLEWSYPFSNISNPILHTLIEDNKHRIEGPTSKYYITYFKEEPSEVKSLLDWTLNKITTDIYDLLNHFGATGLSKDKETDINFEQLLA